ncbi:hypothetical protein DL98DRAFT_617942 [Cadophora sp. DSE1049]|nr:hypothetical protein DL98DRAFT_617942 [Cadophora sp. DSE1049]
MARTSITCTPCKMRKAKCINTGVNSVCTTCQQSGRSCTYRPSGTTLSTKRSKGSAGIEEEGDSKRKKIQKTGDLAHSNSCQAGGDALQASILTRKVLDEVYNIFKLHFATEMPFLHPPTFRKRMRQVSFPRDPCSKTTSDPQDGYVLLLGVLTLTARFHPDLVAYHSKSSQPSDPLVASEYYATALASAFKLTGRGLTNPSLDSIQALLMLGLFEWGQDKGMRAWVYVGTAIRLAQSFGLTYEDDPDYPVCSTSSEWGLGKSGMGISEDLIQKEVRRRTLWSCFIMDRMLAVGKNRPTMIQVENLRVCLPCSDDQFLFAHNAQTSFLRSDWLRIGISAQAKSTRMSNDGALSRYLCLVEIFGRLSDWSCAGGRRTEKMPPWDASTKFSKLRQELEDFQAALPSTLALSKANLSVYIEKRDATTYVSMHTLYSLCLIMLHREYIPFIPLRCQKPQGPLDEPIFAEEDIEIPVGFWEQSAEAIFRAARDVVDIVRACQDSNCLPQTPQITFAVWHASFVCLYAVHFPHMDTGHHLLGQLLQTDQMHVDFPDKSHIGLALKTLLEMSPRSEIAKGYLKLFGKIHDYFQRLNNSYCDRFARKPLRWTGGGLEQYKVLEKDLKEFGSLQQTSDESDTFDQIHSRVSTDDIESPSSINGTPMQGIVAALTSRPNEAWTPINVTNPSVEAEDWPEFSQGPARYPYTIDHQQLPCQSSNPRLISPSHGDSGPYLDYNYANIQGQPGHFSSDARHIITYPSVVHHDQSLMATLSRQTGMQGWTDVEIL